LAVLDGMLVEVANQIVVIPLTSIIETLQPKKGDIHNVNYGNVPYIAAATILGDGQIALIADIDELVKSPQLQRPIIPKPSNMPESAYV